MNFRITLFNVQKNWAEMQYIRPSLSFLKKLFIEPIFSEILSWIDVTLLL